MQIIESTAWWVRSARLVLSSPDYTPQITLFPMIHVGEAEFYEAVYQDAFSHDLALVEGVSGAVARRLTRSYRWLRNAKRIGLAIQPNYPSQNACSAQIVHADLSEDEFEAVWRTVPAWLRFVAYAAAPTIGLRLRLWGSREVLAEALSLDDLPRREEILSFDPETATLAKAIFDARDERLIERLSEQLDRSDPSVERIAIVYGARHMRAVLRELRESRNFVVARADWMKVFGY